MGCILCLVYLFIISFWKMLSNSCTVNPVDDVKSSGFWKTSCMKVKESNNY